MRGTSGDLGLSPGFTTACLCVPCCVENRVLGPTGASSQEHSQVLSWRWGACCRPDALRPPTPAPHSSPALALSSPHGHLASSSLLLLPHTWDSSASGAAVCVSSSPRQPRRGAAQSVCRGRSSLTGLWPQGPAGACPPWTSPSPGWVSSWLCPDPSTREMGSPRPLVQITGPRLRRVPSGAARSWAPCSSPWACLSLGPASPQGW